MKKDFVVIISLICLVAVSCGGGQKKAAATAVETEKAAFVISDKGVGPLTFTADVEDVDFGEDYTVVSTIEEDMGDLFKTVTVTDLEGKALVIRTENYMIDVMAPEFKTAEGIHVGMPLSEVVGIIGEPLTIETFRDLNGFVFKVNDAVGVQFYGSSLKGGQQAYNEWFMKPYDVNVDNFDPGAKADVILIRNY